MVLMDEYSHIVQHCDKVQYPGDKFWDKVNSKLNSICKDAGDDKTKITKYACSILLPYRY